MGNLFARRLSAALVLALSAGTGTIAAGSAATAAPGISDVRPTARSVVPATVPTAAGTTGSAEARPEPAGPYGWPLRPIPTVGRPFQPPSRPYGPGHRGVDLVGAPGQVVVAAGNGVVFYAGPLADRGVVSVRHPDGLRTTYEPLVATVRPGDRVRRGDPLGILRPGHPGCAAAACLHWGLLREREYLDPLALVRPGPVRLLPWTDDVN
jgi:murein DD-endopeptidase MepM/ murein hydrolase activator NlpD